MGRKRAPAEEPEESSRAAGACVLVVLGGTAAAAVFAASDVAGVLTLWVVGVVLLWRSVRRTANPAPPPEVEHPSCRECAGHEPARIEAQKGMLFYSFVLPDRPNHTHVHLAGEVNEA
ncbi:hypothetical protein [Streptomyces sp. NPDC058678]|uniref:hypothetical protein n=1 Tax=Streptomyces sp. NPDC058678 TaxID=3346595 RepID=UPI003652F733